MDAARVRPARRHGAGESPAALDRRAAVGRAVRSRRDEDVLGWVLFGTFGRQGRQRDVGKDCQLGRHAPAGPIEKENRVFAGSDGLADLLEMQVHRFVATVRRNEPRAVAVVGADRAENIGRDVSLP